MPTIAPAGLVVGAARAPLPYGLFSTFTLRAPGADRWESGVTWESPTCEPLGGIGQASCVPGAAGTHEVQGIAVTGAPTGGTYILVYESAPAQVPFDSNAAVIQAALRTITKDSGLTVTGTPAAFVVTFSTSGDKSQITANGSGLTGGVTPGVTTSTTTPGTADGPGSFTAVGLPKVLDGNGSPFGEASPFIVYGHWSCLSTGYNPRSAQDLATQHLIGREQQRVEQAFWSGDLGNVPNLAGTGTAPDPVTLAGGTAMGPAAAVALLEDFIGANYGSLGVIHMTRGTALELVSLRVLESVGNGSRLQTAVGTPVAAGSGYSGEGPAGSPAPGAGESWAYVSPAVFGYRGEIETSSSVPGDLFDRGTNQLTAIAERSYLLGFDPCGVGAVKVKLAA
jgi:hypothetical protein